MPVGPNGDINVVVQIPAGTTAKWEVTKPAGLLKWEFKKGKPRNYGMIPRTMMSEKIGGDGDPVDVIVLGPTVASGSVIKAKLIGVLKLLDKGERDEKLIAVSKGTPLYKVNTLEELNRKFVGVTDILRIWFLNYKGPGKIKVISFGSRDEAKRILEMTIREYSQIYK